MKRAVLFLLAALFILLVIEPNLGGQPMAKEDKVPVYNPDEPLQTNEDVETRRSKSKALIYIDPARGGQDAGYTGANQQSEKDLLMQLALTTGNALEKAGYRVEYSRWYDDVPACASEDNCESVRLEQARANQADYILSLSMNQDSSLHRGFSIFTQPNSVQLEDLTNQLADQIQATSYSRFEGIDTDHYDSFPILSDPSIPSILLQVGYITNPTDYSKLSDTKFQTRIANAITQAFLNTVD